MLEQSWNTETSESVELAKRIIDKLRLTSIQTQQIILMLRSLSPYTDYARYQENAFTLAAQNLGFSVPFTQNCNNNELLALIRSRHVFFDSPPVKLDGFVRGLSHGFVRTITLPMIIESAIKADFCHEHILLLESNLRTSKYKTSKILHTDESRFFLVSISGMADGVGIIDGDGYSNDFYRNLVCAWKPDVYFVNKSNGGQNINEAKKRARLAGSELVVLPEISNMHTSNLIGKFFEMNS